MAFLSSCGSLGINNFGQVVGYAGFNCYCVKDSFVYSDSVMVNISTLNEVVNSGWTNLTAHDINDNGQIVGEGILHGIPQTFLLSGANDKDFFHTYVETPMVLEHMIPVPEPHTYAMLLAGIGLLGFMSRRRKV